MVGLLASLKHSLAACVQSLVRQWDAFWFSPEDPLSLGVLRILTGLMLVYTHLVWGLKLEAFFGPNGFQDLLLVQILEPGTTAWTLWGFVPDEYRVTAHWTCVLILMLYTLGLGTTITKWAAPVIAISYANRAPNANFGLDQFNVMLAVYLAVGPCGARLSLDRLWRVRRDGLRSLRQQGCWSIPAVLPSSAARLSTRLIQVHMCVVYFFSGVSKLKGDSWWNGEAVWMALANAEYQTMDMTWLAWHPWVTELATHATTLWEMTFWMFVWKPAWRPLVLLVGAAMHLGIGACLGMWTFGLIMLFTYVSYIPPDKLRLLSSWLAAGLWKPAQRQVLVDRNRWVSLQWAACRKALDLRDRLQLVVISPTAKTSLPKISSPQLITSAEWWARNKGTLTGWPFAACDRLDVGLPRLIVVHAMLDTLSSLQNYFQGKGFDCRAVSDIPSACTALFDRPTDVMLLLGQSPREAEDQLLFRDLLQRAGAHAPASVTMVSRMPSDVRLEETPDHLLESGSATHRHLRTRVTMALRERTCTEEEATLLTAALRYHGGVALSIPEAAAIADLSPFEDE